jgi:serine acetyltransferase
MMNDPRPRANRIRSLKGKSWRVGRGASIGAGTGVLSDITIGKCAMIGAGSLVTRDVPDYVLAVGHPARHIGFVGPDGEKLHHQGFKNGRVHLKSKTMKFALMVTKKAYDKIKA